MDGHDVCLRRAALPCDVSDFHNYLACVSSTSSQESAASPSGSSELECEPSPSARSTPIAEECSNDTGQKCPSIGMCDPSPQDVSAASGLTLTLFAEDSPARTSAPQARELALTERAAAYGVSTPALLAKYDQPTQSWRTSQLCLEGGLSVFSETWPRSGMTRSGIAYQLPPLVPLTSEIASGLLPTPRKNDSEKRGSFDIENLRNGFPAAVKRLFIPTLGKNESKGSSRKRYRGSPHFRGAKMSEGLRICEDDPIYLHPCFAEVVMGFPIGWTELEPQATPSSRKSRKSSGGQS